MVLKVFHCVAHYDMFKHLAAQTYKRDWHVVSSIMTSTFFVDSSYVGVSPVLRHCALLKFVLTIRARIGAISMT